MEKSKRAAFDVTPVEGRLINFFHVKCFLVSVTLKATNAPHLCVKFFNNCAKTLRIKVLKDRF